MSERAERAASGADALRRLTNRRGYSAPEVSRRTGGLVSPSSVRAYLNAVTVPTAKSALAMARLFTPEEGTQLLEAWGLSDLAEAVEEEAATLPPPVVDPALAFETEEHSLRYSGRRLTMAEEDAARVLIDLVRTRGDVLEALRRSLSADHRGTA